MKVTAAKTPATAKNQAAAKSAAPKTPAARLEAGKKILEASARNKAPAAASTAALTGHKPQTGAIKLVSAAISSDGVKTMKQLAPKGYSLQIGEDKRTATQMCVDGKPATYTWDSASLSVKNDKTGKAQELVGKDDAGYESAVKDFTDNYKSATAEDLQYDPRQWDSSRGFTGVGTAGKLMTVTGSYEDFTGGAHPNFGTELQTYDVRTGKQVTLDQLLSPAQFKSIVKQIQQQTPKLKGPDDITGDSFSLGDDAAKIIGSNFSITTDAKGKAQIQVAWESGIHALGGTQAIFTFDAPTDAAFRSKVGFE